MTETILKCDGLEALNDIADQILELFPDDRIFLFSGKMGAGKTTLIKSICNSLRVVDVVSSPTFSIVNEYLTFEGNGVFHFDLYRIKSPVELMDIGFEEYIYSGSYCLIEWPELASELMPSKYVMINIETEDSGNSRIFQVKRIIHP